MGLSRIERTMPSFLPKCTVWMLVDNKAKCLKKLKFTLESKRRS
jgi:hypothetical protein